MKRFWLLLCFLLSLAWAEDDAYEVKIYGIVNFIAFDDSELRIEDLRVILKGTTIEGFLTLGALVKVEGYWNEEQFKAEEVEVKSAPEAGLWRYQGQVIEGKVLGIAFPDLPEGVWLELFVEAETQQILQYHHLVTATVSGLLAEVESVLEDGFIAGGVQVRSKEAVKPGDRILIQGEWNGKVLVDTR